MSAWSGRDVLVTGHTGFQGAWLALWLHHLGARVHGVSLAPPTEPSLFEEARVAELLSSDVRADIRDADAMGEAVQAARPQIVFHLAAQALVRPSYEDPLGTFATNMMGTANILEAARGSEATRAVLVYTTDKAYENREWDLAYREDDPLGGHDPYSASKAGAEIVASSYRRSFLGPAGKSVATVRAGNVIGGGDWAAQRIVPDAVRAFASQRPLVLRSPSAIRPWQHVSEPLRGCLALGQRQLAGDPGVSTAFNFGPVAADHRTVGELARGLATRWPGARVEERAEPGAPHEAGLLRLDASRAHHVLGWTPRWGFERALDLTADWYRRRLEPGFDARVATLDQIRAAGAAGALV